MSSQDKVKSDYKNLKQEDDQEYTFVSHADEERGLLNSVNELNIIQANDISNQSSVCDQSIQLSQSNLDDVVSLKEGIIKPQNVERNQIEESGKLEQSNTEYLEQVLYKYTQKVLNLFKWNREYSSIGQFYFQITFDGLALYYLNKQIKEYRQQYKLSFVSESSIRECINNLSKYPDSYFNKTKQDSKVVIRGQINDPLAINHINNKILDNKYTGELTQQSKILNTKFQVNKEIKCVFDKNLQYQNSSRLSHTASKMNLLTKINAGIVSLFTGYAFKSEFKFEQFQPQQDFYFFGFKQLMPNNVPIFKITNIFKEFDLQKFRVEQAAYVFSILISYGLGIFLAAKIVKNLISWAKNKNNKK